MHGRVTLVSTQETHFKPGGLTAGKKGITLCAQSDGCRRQTSSCFFFFLSTRLFSCFHMTFTLEGETLVPSEAHLTAASLTQVNKSEMAHREETGVSNM